MSMLFKCPGASNIRTPTINAKRCPQCGGEVELFSTDMKVDCPQCGQAVYNNVATCAAHCRFAEQCLGAELYEKLKGKSA